MKHIHKIREILAFEGVDCWLLYCAEGSDPFFQKYFTKGTIVPAVAIVTKDTSTVIVHQLDRSNIESDSFTAVIEYSSRNRLWEAVTGELSRLGYPHKLALNYSTLGDTRVDVLGHGLFLIIRDKLEGAYAHAGVKMELGSSEAIIYALSERKSEDSIEKMRLAAKRADDLLREAFGEIRVGMSERDIAQLVHLRFNEKPNYFLEKGIVSESYAWDEALCPVVLVGPNLTKGGHSEPSEFRIERGHTVYFDFGVKLMFADGTGWASDIQRMGYVLREGEVEAPSEIARTFATLLNAIDTGISTIRPGMLGHQVDALVRHVITSAGYPNYLHATGHAIGETAHDPGALLGNNEAGLAQLRIQPNGVYTIEPRIAIENGGSIEEMIYVSNSGGIAVSPRQTSLFIIG